MEAKEAAKILHRQIRDMMRNRRKLHEEFVETTHSGVGKAKLRHRISECDHLMGEVNAIFRMFIASTPSSKRGSDVGYLPEQTL